jgi:ethanolamine utilization protein EutA
MHEVGFDHGHVSPVDEQDELSQAIDAADRVLLTTVGIDIGSTTSHLMFAQLIVNRLATGLSSRFVVVGRRVVWQSPILLTPYRSDDVIDAEALRRFVDACHRDAGIPREAVDSGAVILTGEALKRPNAKAIAELFSTDAGKFVCAMAGHHLESAMAAYGSGAVALSRRYGNVVLNVDIGGGTTKLALIEAGDVVGTAAVAIGGRLVSFDDRGRVGRIADAAASIARADGFALAVGEVLASDLRDRLVDRMAAVVIDLVNGRPPDGLTERLMLTNPLPGDLRADAVTFSGGVAEYLFGRESREFGDLGLELGLCLRRRFGRRAVEARIWDPGQGIRATAIGTSQHTVEVSGNTILISDDGRLPLRNLKVVRCAIPEAGDIDAGRIASGIRGALVASDHEVEDRPVALAMSWRRDPLHRDLRALADGIARGLRLRPADESVVLVFDGDVGMSVGRILRDEVRMARPVISLDGLVLLPFDYIDIGAVIRPTNVVPVVIKSLHFRTATRDAGH